MSQFSLIALSSLLTLLFIQLASADPSHHHRKPLGHVDTNTHHHHHSVHKPKPKPQKTAHHYSGGIRIPLSIVVQKAAKHSDAVRNRAMIDSGMEQLGDGSGAEFSVSGFNSGDLDFQAQSNAVESSGTDLDLSSGLAAVDSTGELDSQLPPTPTQPGAANSSLHLYATSKTYNQVIGLDSFYYEMNLGIGTPVKEVRAIIDTGSSELVFASKAHGCVPGDGYYCPLQSSTHEEVSDLPHSFTYGTIGVHGAYEKDKLHVGHGPDAVYVRRRVEFFAATRWHGLNPDPNGVQRGIAGLGPQNPRQRGSHLMYELQHNGNLIRTMSGFSNVFTTVLEDCEVGRGYAPVNSHMAGHLVLGAFDADNCHREALTTLDIIPEITDYGQSVAHWTFRVEAMRLVRPPAPAPRQRTQSHSRHRHQQQQQPEEPPRPRVNELSGEFIAMSDSGANAMYFTQDILDELLPRLHGQTFHYNGKDVYLVDCRTQFQLEFKLNGVWTRVMSGHLVKRFDEQWCYLKISHTTMGGGLSVFGQPFGISYCQFHRGDDEQLEIMERRHPATYPRLY